MLVPYRIRDLSSDRVIKDPIEIETCEKERNLSLLHQKKLERTLVTVTIRTKNLQSQSL